MTSREKGDEMAKFGSDTKDSQETKPYFEQLMDLIDLSKKEFQEEEERSRNSKKNLFQSNVSRRMRRIAMRSKKRSRSHEDDRARERKEEMEKKERHNDLLASQLETRVQVLDKYVTHSLTDDIFLAKKELNPWKFRKNQSLDRKWKFVNDVVTMQEFLIAIDDAKRRKHEASRTKEQSQHSLTSPGLSQGSEKPVVSRPGTSDKEIDGGLSDLRQGINNEKELKRNEGLKTSVEASHPVVGKATVYASGRRTIGKSSRPRVETVSVQLVGKSHKKVKDAAKEKDMVRREHGSQGVNKTKEVSTGKDSCGSKVIPYPPNIPPMSTALSTRSSSGSYSKSQPLESAKKPGADGNDSKFRPYKQQNEDVKSRKASDKKSKAVSSISPLTETRHLKQSPYRPEQPSRHDKPNGHFIKASNLEWLELQAKICESKLIFGFGTHHRVDTCSYCGRSGCAGLLNRIRKLDQKPSYGNGHTVQHVSPRMKCRLDDINGIYKRNANWIGEFKDKISLRTNEIKDTEKKKLIDYDGISIHHPSIHPSIHPLYHTD